MSRPSLLGGWSGRTWLILLKKSVLSDRSYSDCGKRFFACICAKSPDQSKDFELKRVLFCSEHMFDFFNPIGRRVSVTDVSTMTVYCLR